MKEDSIASLRSPGVSVYDPLTEILRRGARELLGQAIESEVEEFLRRFREIRDESGKVRVVRNGYLPERDVQTGIGPVPVKVPRVRDRTPDESAGSIVFSSKILPKYLRRTKSLEELIPWLYLKGVSTGDLSEALAALLGSNAPGLSPSTVTRLKEIWLKDLDRWQKRDLSKKRYVYFWADGVYFNARGEEEKACILVIIGAEADGRKELVGLWEGYRESELSWKEVLLDLKDRGLSSGPSLAIGDGALGFWKALREVFGNARKQRCWVHKTANVLNRLPKSLQKQAKKEPARNLDGSLQGGGRKGIRQVPFPFWSQVSESLRGSLKRQAGYCLLSMIFQPSIGSI